jgi:hypothetical protein
MHGSSINLSKLVNEFVIKTIKPPNGGFIFHLFLIIEHLIAVTQQHVVQLLGGFGIKLLS